MRFSKLSTPVNPHVKLKVSELLQSMVGMGFPLKFPASLRPNTNGVGSGIVGVSVGVADTGQLHSKGRRIRIRWEQTPFSISRRADIISGTDLDVEKGTENPSNGKDTV
jgi:hypothetical protein